jgi:hypothetical protein
MNSLAHSIYTRVKPVSDDGDAIETCIGQADVLMKQWEIQSKGCNHAALGAIGEAQAKLEIIIDELTVAMRRERTAEIGGRF